MDERSPAIKHWWGLSSAFITLAIVFFSFFGLADRAVLFFEENTHNGTYAAAEHCANVSTGGYNASAIDGLTIDPVCHPWPFPFDLSLLPGAFAVILLAGGPVVAAYGWFELEARFDSRLPELVRNHSRKVATLLSIVVFLVLFWALGKVGIGIQYLGPSVASALEIIGYAVLGFSVLVVIAPLTHPLVPRMIDWTIQPETVDRYLTKQWRYAQALLSSGLAIVVGGSIPVAFNSTDWFGYIGLGFLVGTLLPPFAAGTIFIAYRIHRIEVNKRG